MSSLPLPRPEYSTPDGPRMFEPGDVVRLRDPFPETADDRGVVVVVLSHWWVVWRSGEIQHFNSISGDDLLVERD